MIYHAIWFLFGFICGMVGTMLAAIYAFEGRKD